MELGVVCCPHRLEGGAQAGAIVGAGLMVPPIHSQYDLTAMAITWSISGRFSCLLWRWILHFKHYNMMLSFVFFDAWSLSCACFSLGESYEWFLVHGTYIGT